MRLDNLLSIFDISRHAQRKRVAPVKDLPNKLEQLGLAANAVEHFSLQQQQAVEKLDVCGNQRKGLEPPKKPVPSGIQQAAAPQSLVASFISKAEQTEVLEQSERALLEEKISQSVILKLIDRLASNNFDEKLAKKQIILRALCKLAVGDTTGCMDDMDIVLQQEPKNRSALLYRAIACSSGIRDDNPIERYVNVRAETRETFEVSPNDYFTQIICLTLLHELSDRKQIQSELRRIVSENPRSSLAWSALAGHSLSLVHFDDSADWMAAARNAACEALRLCWDDKLAFSVLWWSTSGRGSEEFVDKLQNARTSDGNRRLIYSRLHSDLDAIFYCPLFRFDQSLKENLAAL